MNTFGTLNAAATGALIIMSVIGDIKTYRIRNSIILFFIILGTLTNFLDKGLYGIIFSLAAVMLPVVLMFVLYLLRMLGAGDIKLFSAIGALLGPEFVLRCMAYSFVAGGILAIFIIIKRKNARERVKYLFKYFKACLMSRCILDYSDFSDMTDGGRFRFSPAIAAGTLFQVAEVYLVFPYN